MRRLHPPPPGAERAYVAALLVLPAMGPHRLDQLVTAAGSAQAAWELLRRGHSNHPDLARAELRGDREKLLSGWFVAARSIEPGELLHRHQRHGVELLVRGAAGYPLRLQEDPEPPALLFARGDPLALAAPTVAIIGTRRATPYGLKLARSWAAELTEAGVAVVSGLASGIDHAAHEGALTVATAAWTAAPVAVVGSGLDVVYPRSSARLWDRVAEVGLLLSEAPLGTRPEPWRFPARNRIIAGLADLVVVVESHLQGGSLITAEEATARNRGVFAVPGSVHSPASAGTNRLITEGSQVATAVSDLLEALPSRPVRPHRVTNSNREKTKPVALDFEQLRLLEVLGWEGALLDDLVDRTGWSLEVTSAVLDELLRRNLVTQSGLWFIQERDSASH